MIKVDVSTYSEVDTAGSGYRTVVSKIVSTSSVNDYTQSNLPVSAQLYANYPNPFNPTTTISYNLSRSTNVALNIYNILGQKVRTLINEEQTAGKKSVVWDGFNQYGKTMSSGVYIYQLRAGDILMNHKMLIVR